MLRYIYISIFVLFIFICHSQNLIQNPSFENHTGINCGTGTFSVVNNWMQISSPDFYNSTCNPIAYGTPVNRVGSIYPVNGNSYIGIASYYKTLEVKEYIFQHLSTPLIANKSYYVSFYISRADRITYAIKNIGANFSITQPSVAASNTYIPATPQVQNQAGFLSDTTGWTRIEGYFTAQGGEEYMTVGNFNSNVDTDTLFVGTTNPLPSDPGMTYYYIDSVSLYDSLTYVTGINELKQEPQFKLYPNPNNGNMILEYNLGVNAKGEMRIFDITGKVISAYSLQNATGKLQVNEQNLKNGVYYYSILINDKVNTTNKIIIIK